MTYQGRSVFTPQRWVPLLMLGVTALFALGAWMTWRDRGWTWVSVGLGLAAVFLGVGSIVEAIVLRIELTDDAMVVTELTGRRSYPIGEIERVAEAKGTAPVLVLKGGRKVKLPSVAHELGNSVRAWLKARG